MKVLHWISAKKLTLAGAFATASQLLALCFYFWPNAYTSLLFMVAAVPLFICSATLFLWVLLTPEPQERAQA